MTTNYRNLCTAFYDADKPGAPQRELEYYKKFLRPIVGPVVEPMCGSGRFLVPLQSTGVDIYGFDYSRSMIEACQQRIAQKDRAALATFESYVPPTEFQACIIPAGSFSLLSHPEAICRAFAAIHNMVSASGVICLEVCTAGSNADASANVTARAVFDQDGTILSVTSSSKYCPKLSIEEIACYYIRADNGQILDTDCETYTLKRYRENEFESIAIENGFSILDVGPGVFGDSRSIYYLQPNKAVNRTR